MTANKKAKSNSVQAAVEAAVAAAQPVLAPPAHVRLRESDKPFWDNIMLSRARAEWSKADLVVAAQLARTMSDIETNSELLEDEGEVVTNDRGTRVMNPRHSILEQLSRRQMAFMRTLTLGGSTSGASKSRAAGARAAESAARERGEKLMEEGAAAPGEASLLA